MGDTPHEALPLLFFAIIYLGTITLLYSLIAPTVFCNVLGCHSEYSSFYETANPTKFTSNIDFSSYMTNFVINFSILGVFNIIVFAPFIICLGFVALVIAIPSWL